MEKAICHYYEVDGTAARAQTIFTTTNFSADTVPKEAMDQVFRPLLASLFLAAGKGTIPSDLADAIGAVSDVQQDTALGTVAAKYKEGDTDARWPSIGATYTIEIDLH
jgi:hypothetical protein